MSSTGNFAFLLPLFQATFGVAFLVIARWGLQAARCWGAGHLLLAGAYCVPAVLAGVPVELVALLSDTLFLAAFFFCGQALLSRFSRPRRVPVHLAFCALALASSAYAVMFEASLRVELVAVDLGCSLLVASALVSIRARLSHPIDKALFALSALVVADTLVRMAVYVLTAKTAELDGYTASGYAFFQQVSATILGPVFGLTALAAVTLDVLGAYREAAEHDPLTGLLNRRGFERAVVRAGRRSVAAVACDIDHFKRINDEFGHLAGDCVIAGLAEILRGALPQCGFAARFGGEEFVAVLPVGADPLAFAQGVRRALARVDWRAAGINRSVTASFGIGQAAAGDRSLHEAVARADRNLYLAKSAGRDRVMPEEGGRPVGAPILGLVAA